MATGEATPQAAPVAKPRPARSQLMGIRAPVPEAWRIPIAVIPLLILLAAWSVASYGGFVSKFFLPSPTDVLDGLVQLIVDQGLLKAVGVSGLRILAAFVLSVAVAFPLGVLMGSF